VFFFLCEIALFIIIILLYICCLLLQCNCLNKTLLTRYVMALFITLGLISRPSAKMLSLAQHLSVYAVSCTVHMIIILCWIYKNIWIFNWKYGKVLILISFLFVIQDISWTFFFSHFCSYFEHFTFYKKKYMYLI
jgi:hypothetical protein